jgi:hypothetical protein
MFVDKVDQTWRGLFLKEVSAADTVLVAKSLFQTFFSEEAQWEVSITAAEKNRLKALISAPPPSGFDASLFDKVSSFCFSSCGLFFHGDWLFKGLRYGCSRHVAFACQLSDD